MRFVIQRVTEASVTIDGEISGKIGKGYLVLIGVADTDTKEIADKMIRKMIGLRIFEDEQGKTNLSLDAVGGELCAFGHSTRNDCCGGGAEHKVENKVGSVGKSVGRAFDKGLEVCEKIHIGYTDQSEKGILTHHKGITEK